MPKGKYQRKKVHQQSRKSSYTHSRGQERTSKVELEARVKQINFYNRRMRVIFSGIKKYDVVFSSSSFSRGISTIKSGETQQNKTNSSC